MLINMSILLIKMKQIGNNQVRAFNVLGLFYNSASVFAILLFFMRPEDIPLLGMEEKFTEC